MEDLFQMKLIINVFNKELAHIRLRVMPLNHIIRLIGAWVGMYKDAFLQFIEPKLPQMMAQGIANISLTFRDVKNNHAPLSIPAVRPPNFHRINLEGKRSLFPLTRKYKGNGTVGI